MNHPLNDTIVQMWMKKFIISYQKSSEIFSIDQLVKTEMYVGVQFKQFNIKTNCYAVKHVSLYIT